MALVQAFKWQRVALLAVPAWLGCGPTTKVNDPSASASGTASAVATATKTTPSTTPIVFDVHEWGLLDVTSSSARLLAGPAARTAHNAPVRKPVVYFHLADGSAPGDVTLRVDVPATSKFMEAFPVGDSLDQKTLTWAGLHLRREACHVVGAPTRDLPACKTPDGLCEAADVATYEAADASCVGFGNGSFNHLLYRANGALPSLPFEVTASGANIDITHARASDTLGSIVYVHNDGGVASATILAVPAVGQLVTAIPPKESDVSKAQAELDRVMHESGLTEAEVAAFDRAWATDLLGGPARETPTRRAAVAPDDYLLFAMPVSLIEGVSTLSVTPPPRAVRRFMLVRLHV